MTQITTQELPEAFQQLLLEVDRTNDPLTITHQGKPLVIVYPATTPKPRAAFGCMKGSGKILGDIVSPIEQPWEVLQ
jgi:antitoxin VapB